MKPPELFAIIWDPAVVSEAEYAELVVAIGDLVRAHGGIGVEQIESRTEWVNTTGEG